MKLSIILICLFAERYLTGLSQLRRQNWIEYWIEFYESLPLSEHLRHGYIGLAALLLPPIAALWLLQSVVGGVLSLLLSIWVLFYSLGPEVLDTEVRMMMEAHESGLAGQFHTAENALLQEGAYPSHKDRTWALMAGVFTAAVRRLFGVLFWFLVLGPVGAFAYRIGCELRVQVNALSYTGLQSAASDAQWFLDWPVARLVASLFALMGHFEAAIQAWREYRPKEHSASEGATAIAVNVGVAALQSNTNTFPPFQFSDEMTAVKAAYRLVERALVLFVVELALVTLGGAL
jgi:AmpE protein